MARFRRALAVSLVVVALVGVLVPGHAASTGAAQAEAVWSLADITVYFNPPPAENVRVSGLSADGNSGQALISLDGRAFNLCPGGAEQMLVKWRFDRSVEQLRAGERFALDVHGVPDTARAPCDGGLLYRSFLNAATGGGHTVGWWTPDAAATMYEGFRFTKGDRGWGPDWSGQFALTVNEAYPPEVDGTGALNRRTHAWFSIWVQNPGRDVEIVYLYDLVRAGARPPQPPPGGSTPLGGLDLRGFCRAIGADDVGLDGDQWFCGFVDDWVAIDMTAACQWQYQRPDAVARHGTPGDPQTWACFAPTGSGTGDGSGGAPAPPAPRPPESQTIRGRSGGPVGCIGCDGKYRVLTPGRNGVALASDRHDAAAVAAAGAVPGAGTLRNLRVQASGADGGTWYFFLYRPGQPGGLSCTLDATRNPGQTVCEDRAGALDVAASDRIVLAVGNPGSPLTPGQFSIDWSVEFTPR